MRACVAACSLVALMPLFACAPPLTVGQMPEAKLTAESAELVGEVRIGIRKVANAAWWGFDPKDATAALQGAIDSGATTVIVPDLGKDWIVSKSIRLASRQEVLFQRGVTVTAMKGKFLARGEPLFLAENRKRVVLRGYGATLRMRKPDYTKPPYKKAEWRHALSIRGCTDVGVYGLTLRDSGGDGIYLGATKAQPWNRNIHIKDVTCDNNHRQGISIITAQDLLVEDCRFINTRGTAPQAGIDLEPNHPNERLVNVVIRNCLVEGNAGPGIYAYLKHLDRRSRSVSILVEDCTVRRCGSFGIGGGAVKDDGPAGRFTYRDVTVEETNGPGAYVYDKAADRARFKFVRCRWRNVARKHGSPLVVFLRRPQMTWKHGGVRFLDCLVEDDRDRPVLAIGARAPGFGVRDVRGTITVANPHGARMDLGPKHKSVRLRLTE